MRIKNIEEDKLNEIAEAFSDYEYEENEAGLFYRCKGREGVRTYIRAFAMAGIKSGWVYTSSEKEEGYIMISEPGSKADIPSMFGVIAGCLKAMGFKGSLQFVKDIKNAGISLESKLKKEKKPCVRIEMLVVRKAYQNQGYMRKLIEIAFEKADKQGIPCIVSTDGRLKAEKYKHLGFEHYGTRRFRGNSYEYDLIRYPRKKEYESVK